VHYILGTMVGPYSTVSQYYWIYCCVRRQSCTKIQKWWNVFYNSPSTLFDR